MRLWSFFFLFAPAIFPADVGLTFESNRGQTAADIRFIARASSGVIFVTDRGILLSAPPQSVLAFELEDADLTSPWQPERATGQTISYFIGRDPSQWIEDLPRYERLVRRNVYPGIDLVLYGSEGQLEYDFELAPHADPSRIRSRLTDAQRISIAPDGALVVATPAGELRHRAPLLTEILPDGSRRSIAGRFEITAPNEIGFVVEGHNPALALSIDPILESSTYFGGHGNDAVIATDGNGTLVGNTTSIDVPNATFARRAGTNIFIAQSQQTTVIGCTGNVTVTSAAFSYYYGPNIVVGGYADCSDLPTNIGAGIRNSTPPLQPNYGGGATDGFLLLAYAPQGSFPPTSNLTLSYIGGPGDDRINAVAFTNGFLAIAGSTTEGGLPAPAFLNAPVPSALAGGSDAFLLTAYAYQEAPVQLVSTLYLGGSGDDTALGVAIAGGIVYITGQTESPDFPLVNALYSKRQGPSDAFVAEIINVATVSASTLFGGSGADQATAIIGLPSGNIAIAGVTSSSDLPLKNPTQKTYGGGASDAFVAQFSPDLSTLISSTYIGGSDADQATSIAASYPNTVFVGGWTASNDFPTVNALQAKYGGGSSDGFLVHFDDDGSIYESTFFGGSGSDQVLGLKGSYLYDTPTSFYGPTVWMTGTTSSPDLPLEKATQSSLLGTANGFIAEVTADLFSISVFTFGKDLRVPAYIYPGNPELAGTTTFTVSSSDASKVQLAADTTSPGEGSTTFTSSVSPAVGTFYVDCLTDSGGATLTISAAGYKTKTAPVACLPEAISVSYPNPILTNVGAPPSAIYFSLVPDAPQNAGATVGATPRPGAAPVTVQIANSNPSIGTISASSLTLNGAQGENITFTPQAIGSADLTFTFGTLPFLPSNKVTVNIAGMYSAPTPFTLPAGFQTCYSLLDSSGSGGPSATVTSSNPAKIALSLDATKTGGASVNLPEVSSSFCVQAVGSSGSANLTISIPGQPNVNTTVSIAAPVVVLARANNIVQALQLQVGATATLGFYISTAGPDSTNALRLNPGHAPISISLQSSNPGVVGISPSSVQITPNTVAYNFEAFQITAVAAGSTQLSLVNSVKIPNGGPFRSQTVIVAKPSTSVVFPDIEIGKDLMSSMALILPAPAKSDVVVTVTVADPTLALLSLDGKTPGLAQLTTIIPGGQTVTWFYVYALGGPAQTEVSAVVPGYGTATANVLLDPSGLYWSQDSETIGVGPTNLPFTLVGPLDSATGIPVGSQALRPDFETSPTTYTSSNPKVVTITQNAGSAQAIAVAPGTTTVTLQQPPGFSAASVRQRLLVTVTPSAPPTVSFPYNNALAKYTQAQLSFSGYTGNPTLTVTSSDPSKLLLSTNTAKLGSASVKSQAGQPVYAQALAGSGKVTVKVSAAGFADASAVLTLVPTGIGISITTSSGVTFQNGVYTTTTDSVALNINVGFFAGPPLNAVSIYLPGMSPITATISSSNTGVAVITGSPITVNPGFAPGSATLLQVGPGQTTISISQPAGFTSVGNDQLTVQVIAPSLAPNNIIAAKDILTPSSISLAQGIKSPSVSLPVTLTSSDPTRVLLSPDPATPPSASITAPIPAGSNGASFYIHPLSDNGSVSIQAAATGYGGTTLAVQLVPLAFEFANLSNGPTNVFIQSGPQTAQVTGVPLLPGGGFYPYQGPLVLRPGVSKIVVDVTSSDPSVVSVSPAQIVFENTIGSSTVTYTPRKPGTATLKLTVPSSYTTVPSQAQMSISASEASFTFYNLSSLELGKDLQAQLQFYPAVAVPNLSVTVTSSNPSLVLVSPDTNTPGQQSIVVTSPSPGTNLTVNVQALAGSGAAKLTFSAPGLQSTTLPVILTAVGGIFGNQGELNALTNAGVLEESIQLTPLDPVTLQPINLQPGQTQSPRPGANLSVAVTTSNPQIITVTTPTVQLAPVAQGAPTPSAGVQPIAVGTAIVSLGALAGNPLPASGNQIVFNVTEPALSIPPITVGRDLQVPVQMSIGSAAPTPSVDLVLSVNTSAPVQLAANPTDPGQFSINVTIPAGQRISKVFYVQGLSAGLGTLNYGGGQFQNYTTSVTVTNTAFIIKEAANGQPLNIDDDASANLTVVPSLSPETTTASGPLSIRGGANPITVAIASTNPVVVTVTSQVVFNPGDQSQVFGVHGSSPGHATVELLGTNYDFSQPQASIQVVVASAGIARH